VCYYPPVGGKAKANHANPMCRHPPEKWLGADYKEIAPVFIGPLTVCGNLE